MVISSNLLSSKLQFLQLVQGKIFKITEWKTKNGTQKFRIMNFILTFSWAKSAFRIPWYQNYPLSSLWPSSSILTNALTFSIFDHFNFYWLFLIDCYRWACQVNFAIHREYQKKPTFKFSEYSDWQQNLFQFEIKINSPKIGHFRISIFDESHVVCLSKTFWMVYITYCILWCEI